MANENRAEFKLPNTLAKPGRDAQPSARPDTEDLTDLGGSLVASAPQHGGSGEPMDLGDLYGATGGPVEAKSKRASE